MTSSRVFVGFAAILVAGALAAAAVVTPAPGQDHPKQPSKRSVFMRQKLELSKHVLEGLAREDFDLIEKNAKAIKALSQAAEWEDPKIPHPEQYLPYTAEFQRLATELAKKAKAKNIDGATLAYVQLTVNCVNCHKYVRESTK